MTPHLELEEELVSVFRSALKTAGFIGGPVVEEFEQEFSRFCEASHCVGVGSGTDALRFALNNSLLITRSILRLLLHRRRKTQSPDPA